MSELTLWLLGALGVLGVLWKNERAKRLIAEFLNKNSALDKKDAVLKSKETSHAEKAAQLKKELGKEADAYTPEEVEKYWNRMDDNR